MVIIWELEDICFPPAQVKAGPEEIVPMFRSRNRCHHKRIRNEPETGPLTESSVCRNGEAAEGSDEAEELEEEMSLHFSSVCLLSFKRPCFRFGRCAWFSSRCWRSRCWMAEEDRIRAFLPPHHTAATGATSGLCFQSKSILESSFKLNKPNVENDLRKICGISKVNVSVFCFVFLNNPRTEVKYHSHHAF